MRASLTPGLAYVIIQTTFNFSFVFLIEESLLPWLNVLRRLGFYFYGDPHNQGLDPSSALYESNRQQGMFIDIVFFMALLYLIKTYFASLKENENCDTLDSTNSATRKSTFPDKMTKMMMSLFHTICNFVRSIMHFLLLVFFFFISLQKSDVLHLLYLVMVISFLVLPNHSFNWRLVAFTLGYTCVSIICRTL